LWRFSANCTKRTNASNCSRWTSIKGRMNKGCESWFFVIFIYHLTIIWRLGFTKEGAIMVRRGRFWCWPYRAANWATVYFPLVPTSSTSGVQFRWNFCKLPSFLRPCSKPPECNRSRWVSFTSCFLMGWGGSWARGLQFSFAHFLCPARSKGQIWSDLWREKWL
jgi:hypothetical protein